MAKQIFFITGTDTHVGKTITTAALALRLKSQGLTVGVMKPVQCAGFDTHFLKKTLGFDDDLSLMNPFFAKEPLSPHLAMPRAGIRFQRKTVQTSLNTLKARYDCVLIEGAGGLLVPITSKYNNADLAGDLNAELIIVSRLGLGTINHTILTIEAALRRGLKIRGIIFSASKAGLKTLPEQTNPTEIARLTGVKVLGIIPYMKTITLKGLKRACQHITIN